MTKACICPCCARRVPRLTAVRVVFGKVFHACGKPACRDHAMWLALVEHRSQIARACGKTTFLMSRYHTLNNVVTLSVPANASSAFGGRLQRGVTGVLDELQREHDAMDHLEETVQLMEQEILAIREVMRAGAAR